MGDFFNHYLNFNINLPTTVPAGPPLDFSSAIGSIICNEIPAFLANLLTATPAICFAYKHQTVSTQNT